MKVLTAAQMQQVDRLTTEKFHVLGLTLMETAGMAAVAAIERHFSPLSLKHIKIFCGKGNNGGDGAVVARHLWLKGAIVELFLMGKFEETRGDARVNFEAVRSLSSVEAPKLSFQEIESTDELHDVLTETCDLYVDALFGTGAARPLTGIFKELVEYLNESNIPIVAIDIPSGLNADSSQIIGPTIQAQLTVTMTAPKIANVLPPALHYNGTLVTVPIGSPNSLLETCGTQLTFVEKEHIESFLTATRRQPGFHKSDVGHVLLIAGGQGKTGAAGLSAEAILRAGAGLVTLATPTSSFKALGGSLSLEIMSEPLPETATGTVATDALTKTLELSEKKAVLAVGPGIGHNEDTRNFISQLVDQRKFPLVIDADGLNSLSPWPDALKGGEEFPLILTPHPGEMGRLLNISTKEVIKNPVELARKFATNNQVILVLKGERTLIAAPNGEIYINPTGNAGMATAGSGDVLTGIIAGLLSQCRKKTVQQALEATIAGVYLHGLAGDIAAKNLGQRSVIAGEILKSLPAAILSVGGEIEKRNFFDPLSRRDI